MGSMPQLSILHGPQREHKPRRLHQILEDNIPLWEQRIALIFDEDHHGGASPIKTNYKDLNEISNQIGRTIIRESALNFSKSNQDGDWVVAVCMQPTDRLVEILLSIWKSGAAYLPLDPTFPANRIQHILKEARPFLVIHDDNVNPEVFGQTPSLSLTKILNRSSFMEVENICEQEALSNYKNDIALVLYTSGSTGIPKGVRLPHSIILNRLQWQWERFPYTNAESVGVFKTALTFVDSLSEIWGPLLSGLSILIVPKEITKDPERLVRLLEQYKIRRLVLVPTLLRSILMYLLMNKRMRFLYNLQNWICSGEALAISLVRTFYDYFEEGVHELYNFYGSTEVMGDVTYFKCEGKKQMDSFEKVPIGQPINNTVIYLLDADYRPVKKGEIGEIFVAGLNLAHGYTNARDPHRFIDNPMAIDAKYARLYRTGDYGCIINDTIMYEGRTDSQIKIRGHRVDLSEIEKSILSLDCVERAIPLCYHPGEVDQSLIAFVTLKERTKNPQNLDIETLLKQKLPNYMIPQIIIIDNVPLLVNGKVDRQTLLKMYEVSNNNNDFEDTLEFNYDGVPDDLKLIATDLFETIGIVLGKSLRTTLSIDRNFYELGGNSLNSIFTVSVLREKGFNIGISDFIGATNLKEILFKLSKSKEITPMDEEPDNSLEVTVRPLRMEDKEDSIKIIAASFYEKADLEHWLKPDISLDDYTEIMELIWEPLLNKDLSFILRDKSGDAIGVTLNFDARDEPEVHIKSKLFYVFDFLEFVEGPIRDNVLPKGHNKILHSFMMGTSEKLNAQQNIAVMHLMEREVLNLAKQKGFVGIFTTNTNPLTQQLGSDIYKYKVMLDYQVNQYIHPDGSRPFGSAPDNQRAIVQWKEIETQ